MARKVKFDFKPLEGVRVTGRQKSQIMQEVKDFVTEQVLDHVGSSKSPVAGGSFKKSLEKNYKKKKVAQGGASVANLDLSGSLLDSLRVIKKDENTLRLTVLTGEQKKADGHNNFSGKSNLPERNFIPDEKREQNLNRTIWKGIRDIVKGIKGDES